MKRFLSSRYFQSISLIIFFFSIFGLYGLQMNVPQSYAQQCNGLNAWCNSSNDPTNNRYSCCTQTNGKGRCINNVAYCASNQECNNVNGVGTCQAEPGLSCSCVNVVNGKATPASDGTSPNYWCSIQNPQKTGTCAGGTECYAQTTTNGDNVVCKATNQGCTCAHNDSTVPGQNGRTCGGQDATCATWEYCHQSSATSNDAQCVHLPTVCENPVTPQPPGPGIQGFQLTGANSGQYLNGFKATYKDTNGNTQTYTAQDLANMGDPHAYCPHGYICQNNQCIQGTCLCEHPGQSGTGQNGITCGGFPANQICDQNTTSCANLGYYCPTGSICNSSATQQATCQQASCDCQYPNDDTAVGHNGKVCGGFLPDQQNPPNYCQANEICHEAGKGNAQCKPMSCYCKHNHGIGSGQNTEVCSYQGSAQREVAVCATTDECVDSNPVGNPTCLHLTCTCKNPNVNGDISVTCSDSSGNSTTTNLPNCDASKNMCVNDSSGKATCKPYTEPQQSNFPSPIATFPPVNWCPNSVCNTALGPIAADPAAFIQKIFGIVLSLAGGIAILVIIYSGYIMMTSAGNPEKVEGAKETLTAAIVGLVFTVFSLVILEAIGVDILQIPGFSH